MLSDITPLILTYNEADNIQRVLERLRWAHQILVVDSFSTDDTLRLIAEFPTVKVVQRTFDHFSHQCNFGLSQIHTQWTLSLDADYVCPAELPHELANITDDIAGYRAQFRYCIKGSRLRATLYPPRIVLYQTALAQYYQDGHAHRVRVLGQVAQLKCVIEHDDRKSFSRWVESQTSYARKEAEKLVDLPIHKLDWNDRLRKMIVLAPLLSGLYCLFGKGLILDGWPGVFYALQRVYAELALSLQLLDRTLGQSHSTQHCL